MTRDDAMCRDCRFWHRLDPGYGQCRLCPPTVSEQLLAEGDEGEADDRTQAERCFDASIWPITFDDDFCGKVEVNAA